MVSLWNSFFSKHWVVSFSIDVVSTLSYVTCDMVIIFQDYPDRNQRATQ